MSEGDLDTMKQHRSQHNWGQSSHSVTEVEQDEKVYMQPLGEVNKPLRRRWCGLKSHVQDLSFFLNCSILNFYWLVYRTLDSEIKNKRVKEHFTSPS